MRKVYNDLCELIANDEKAEGYFALLPEFVKARLYKSPEKNLFVRFTLRYGGAGV